MNNICVKLKQREKNKYRKMLSTNEIIYSEFDENAVSTSPYSSGAILEDEEWFCISEASKQKYANELMSGGFSTVDFESLDRKDFGKIDFLFVLSGKSIFFQNISKAKLVSKKRICHFGEGFKYESNCDEITVNDFPDAIYQIETDTLYFHRLESVVSIFRGIDQLYKEATHEETETFLCNDFISLKDGYSAAEVKKANRKRIALAQKTLAQLTESDRKNIFSYIGEYCPNLKTSDKTFQVGTENELRMLLYGIEQRFYTTPVGSEQRIANSVIALNQGGAN